MIATATPVITSEFSSIQDVGWYGAAFQAALYVIVPLMRGLRMLTVLTYEVLYPTSRWQDLRLIFQEYRLSVLTSNTRNWEPSMCSCTIIECINRWASNCWAGCFRHIRRWLCYSDHHNSTTQESDMDRDFGLNLRYC